MARRQVVATLPSLLRSKIYKTGQTRGADDDEIFQNRVGRNSTVLIPYSVWPQFLELVSRDHVFENGYIVLIPPAKAFNGTSFQTELRERELALGENAVVFYETRGDWNSHPPEAFNWEPARSRVAPLGGQYVARIPAITSAVNGGKIVRGFNSTASKGAGIRVYEYASRMTIEKCRLQLEALVWLCHDSEKVISQYGMNSADITSRKSWCIDQCEKNGLLDLDRLVKARTITRMGRTICPLCLDELSSSGFFSRMDQAEGREVLDLTVTQLNLFHIKELRIGVFNHRPYNLGWGHHHCNVVVKDSGIDPTLEWMWKVLERNRSAGYSIGTSQES